MSRSVRLLLALAIAALLAGCGDDDEPAIVNGDGYSFQTPAGWKEGDGEALGQAVGGGDVFDTFVAGDVTDEFAENFNVIVQENVPGGLDVNAWARQSAAFLERPGVGTRLFPGAESFEPPSAPPQRTDLGGEEAYEIAYSATRAQGEVHFLAVLTIHDGRGYIGTLASPEGAAAAEEAFSEIVDSWEFG